jgi:hypothetical protein
MRRMIRSIGVALISVVADRTLSDWGTIIEKTR